VQGYVTLITVSRGIGRHLIEEALAHTGVQRLDLLSTEGADDFYRSLPHWSI
jgi:hypothetical protein